MTTAWSLSVSPHDPSLYVSCGQRRKASLAMRNLCDDGEDIVLALIRPHSTGGQFRFSHYDFPLGNLNIWFKPVTERGQPFQLQLCGILTNHRIAGMRELLEDSPHSAH